MANALATGQPILPTVKLVALALSNGLETPISDSLVAEDDKRSRFFLTTATGLISQHL
jgi:hypothetical protein